MWEKRRSWCAWLPVLAATVLLTAGFAQAAGDPPKLVRPNLNLPVLLPTQVNNPQILSSVLLQRNLLEVLSPRSIVTPDKLPPASIGTPLKLSTPVQLRASDALVDLTRKPTDVQVGNQRLKISPDILTRPVFELAAVAVTIDYVESVARGQYYVHFRYSIWGDDVPLPLRFQLNIEGQARPYVSWIPFVHASGPAHNAGGYVVALMHGTDVPLMARADKIGISVVDGTGTNRGNFSQSQRFTFVKRYADITRDDIKNYFANSPAQVKPELPIQNPPVSATPANPADKPILQVNPNLVLGTGIGAAAQPSVATRLTGARSLLSLQNEYLMEPAMVFFRTNQGNFAKTLLRAEREGSNPWHVAIWDSRCYAKDQATFNSWPFMANGSPSNTEYVQLFERGGYLLNTWTFDFDRDGGNPTANQDDVWLNNPSGPATQKLDANNGAALAW